MSERAGRRYLVDMGGGGEFNGVDSRGAFVYETQASSGLWIRSRADDAASARAAHEAIARSLGLKLAGDTEQS